VQRNNIDLFFDLLT